MKNLKSNSMSPTSTSSSTSVNNVISARISASIDALALGIEIIFLFEKKKSKTSLIHFVLASSNVSPRSQTIIDNIAPQGVFFYYSID